MYRDGLLLVAVITEILHILLISVNARKPAHLKGVEYEIFHGTYTRHIFFSDAFFYKRISTL